MKFSCAGRPYVRLIIALIAAVWMIITFSAVRAANTQLIDISSGNLVYSAPLPAAGFVRIILKIGPANEVDEILLGDFVGETPKSLHSVRLSVPGATRTSSGKGVLVPNDGRDPLVLFLEGSQLWLPGTYVGELELRKNGTIGHRLLIKLEREGPKIRGNKENGAVTIDVPFDGLSSLTLDGLVSPPGAADPKAHLSLTTFVGPKADSRKVLFSEKEGSEKNVPLADSIDVSIDASQLPLGKQYRGELRVEIDGHKLQPFPIMLTRAKPNQDALLVLTGLPGQLELSCSWPPCRPEPIDIVLSEKSNQLPIEGVSVTAVSSSSPRNLFNPVSNLTVKFLESSSNTKKSEQSSSDTNRSDSTNGADLWGPIGDTAVNQAQRQVPAGQNRIVRIGFPALGPGEYETKLRFRAMNADLDALPEAGLSVQVKLHPVYAAAILFVSVLISYGSMKWIGGSVARAKLRSEIRRLENSSWLRRNKSRILPIVQVAAALKRIRYALDREWCFYKLISVPNVYNSQLELIKKREPFLRRLSNLEDYWFNGGGRNEHHMVAYRAQEIFRDIVRELGNAPLDQDLFPELETRIAALENWRSDRSELESGYWTALSSRIERLKLQVRIENFDDAKEEQDTLLSILETFMKSSAPLIDFQKTAEQCFDEAGDRAGLTNQSLENFCTYRDRIVDEASEIDLSWAKNLNLSVKIAIKGLREAEKNDLASVAPALTAVKAELKNAPEINIDSLRKLLDNAKAILGSDAEAKQVLEQLSKVFDWIENPKETGESKLSGAKGLLATIKDSEQRIVTSLFADLDKEKTPALTVTARDESYAKLKIIWNQHQSYNEEKPEKLREKHKDRFSTLIEAVRKEDDFQTIFDKTDRWAWEDILDNKDNIIIQRPDADHNPPQAYQLFALTVEAPEFLGDKFLFNRRLLYKWEIKYSSKDGIREGKLTPQTREPRINVFIPVECKKVTASATIEDPFLSDAPILINGPSLTIEKSTQFTFVRAFQRAEVVALLIASLVAVGTGLQTDISENFLISGTFYSFLSLVLWGFGTEQLTRIVQHIDNLVKKPAAS